MAAQRPATRPTFARLGLRGAAGEGRTVAGVDIGQMLRWMRVAAAVAILAALADTAPGQTANDVAGRVYASGFSSPVAIVQHPSNRDIQYVVEQGGRIRVVENGTVLPADFLTLTTAAIATGGERGLLGMALAPDYASSGRFYLNFTNPAGHTVIARYRRSSNPLVADPASRFDLRWNGSSAPAYIAQPYSNHNGGHLAFGADGYLYVGMGDGGSSNDPEHHAQTPNDLLGKMLRIDVNVPDADPIGYRVPVDNPFVSGALGARPEIWSFGWRNPWRFSFDDPARGGTGALVAGDVGQGAWEEVDYEPAGRSGRNYGWRNREGANNNVTTRPPAYTPLTDPIFQYNRTAGQSISGGIVYRGAQLPQFRGRYFFADFVQGRVWSFLITVANGEGAASNLLDHTASLATPQALGTISAFGVDADGELFIVCYGRGAIVRVTGAAPSAPQNLRIVR